MSDSIGCLSCLCLSLILAAPLAVPRSASADVPAVPRGAEPITVIAHRGNASHAPENTVASFRSAIEAKADYVELDAYPSADGTLWVLHDATLDRTTDIRKHAPGQKIKLTATHDDLLKKLEAGAWFDKAHPGADHKFAGEKLPTLADALDAIQKNGKTLIERKEGTPAAYAELLKSKKLVNKLIVQAFDWEFLEGFHKLLPDQVLAALGSKELSPEKLAKLPATGVKIVAWEHKELNAANVRDLHGRGYRVWTWTPDEPADWQRLLDIGVDGIITNRPGELRAWLADHPRKPSPAKTSE